MAEILFSGEFCHLHAPSVTHQGQTPHDVFFNEGVRSVAIRLQNRMEEIQPGVTARLMAEWVDAEDFAEGEEKEKEETDDDDT